MVTSSHGLTQPSNWAITCQASWTFLFRFLKQRLILSVRELSFLTMCTRFSSSLGSTTPGWLSSCWVYTQQPCIDHLCGNLLQMSISSSTGPEILLSRSSGTCLIPPIQDTWRVSPLSHIWRQYWWVATWDLLTTWPNLRKVFSDSSLTLAPLTRSHYQPEFGIPLAQVWKSFC